VENAGERLIQLVRCRTGELRDDGLTLLIEQLLLRLLQALLHTHLFAKVREEADASDRALAFVEESARERDRDLVSLQVDDHDLQSSDPAAAGLDRPHDLFGRTLWIQRTNVGADDVGGQLSVDSLRGAVEEHDSAAHVGADDRVERRVDDALEKLLRLE